MRRLARCPFSPGLPSAVDRRARFQHRHLDAEIRPGWLIFTLTGCRRSTSASTRFSASCPFFCLRWSAASSPTARTAASCCCCRSTSICRRPSRSSLLVYFDASASGIFGAVVNRRRGPGFGGPAYQSLIPSLVGQGGPAQRRRPQFDPVQPGAGRPAVAAPALPPAAWRPASPSTASRFSS